MKISINNKLYHINTDNELTILQACELINIHIPRFCYHDKLSIAGNCRMCFVELPKAKKPALACSTTIHDGIELYTNTFVVKKAQESVLEFLLINHPLDCPICDQAGECDLQELTKNFGSDRGRFNEMKRSVEDLELGTLVKTIMTRCIHCTRCIRYASEILTIPALGTSGRGRDTEVSMYINKILHSELSGNIVDLCPVGALTSKPYAFRARPWELSHVESIDVLDNLGSSIRLDFKGNRIMRILPRTNDTLNEEWITDKIRYSYDSLSLQRLTSPSLYLTHQQKYISTSWSFILSYLSNYLIYYKTFKDVYLRTGNLLDYESAIGMKFLAQTLLTSQFNSKDYSIDLRSQFLLSNSLPKLEDKELYLIVGSNLDYESPLMKLRIQKNRKKKKIFNIGQYWNSMIPTSKHYGLSSRSLISLYEGRNSLCYEFFNKDKTEILYRYNDSSNGRVPYSSLLHKIHHMVMQSKSRYLFSYLNTIGISNLSTHLGTLQASEVGLVNNYSHSNHFVQYNSSKNSINLHVLSHTDNITPDHLVELGSSNDFNIYIGHHKSLLSDLFTYNIILPTSSYVEQKQYYINNIGMITHTNKALGATGKSKPLSSIITKLFSKLNGVKLIRDLKDSLHQIKDYNINYNSYLHRIMMSKFSLNAINTTTGISSKTPNCIPLKLMYYYHCSDLVTYNSPIMTKLVKERKEIESTFYNNATYSI